jgi:hypothetical protein
MMKLPAPKEKEITHSIRSLLRQFGIFHWKVHQGLGCQPGVPDIVGITTGGKFFGCEVKTEKGVLSEHQSKFIQNINAAGGIGFVARNLEDVIEHLDLKRGMLF